jgi:hypothetical protein
LVRSEIAKPLKSPTRLTEALLESDRGAREIGLQRSDLALRVFDYNLNAYRIPQENIYAIATEPWRMQADPLENDALLRRFQISFGDRPIVVATGIEEALLITYTIKSALTVKDPATAKINGLVATHGAVCISIGGGSAGISVITRDGEIIHAAMLPWGILKLKAHKDSGDGKISTTGKIFQEAMEEVLSHSLLKSAKLDPPVWCAIGGVTRSLAPVLDKGGLPILLHAPLIRERQIDATKREPPFFANHSQETATYADFLALTAAMLRRASDHVRANHMAVLDGRMVTTIAELHHARLKGNPSPPGLARLFSPSAQAQVSHA